MKAPVPGEDVHACEWAHAELGLHTYLAECNSSGASWSWCTRYHGTRGGMPTCGPILAHVSEELKTRLWLQMLVVDSNVDRLSLWLPTDTTGSHKDLAAFSRSAVKAKPLAMILVCCSGNRHPIRPPEAILAQSRSSHLLHRDPELFMLAFLTAAGAHSLGPCYCKDPLKNLKLEPCQPQDSSKHYHTEKPRTLRHSCHFSSCRGLKHPNTEYVGEYVAFRRRNRNCAFG